MKRLLLPIIAITLTVNGIAQTKLETSNKPHLPVINPIQHNADKTGKEQIDSILSDYFDLSKQSWGLDFKQVYHTSQMGYTSDVEYMQYDGMGGWTTLYKIEYKYDGDNKLIEATNLIDEGTGYIVESHNIYSYDTNNNLTEMTTEYWNEDTQQFVPYSKTTNTYNVTKNIIESASYLWDDNESEWDQNGFMKYVYDAKGIILYTVDHYALRSGQELLPIDSTLFTTNGNGLVENTLMLSWSDSARAFLPNEQALYTYDANGNPETEIYAYWVNGVRSFVNSDKYTYTYDSEKSASDLIIPQVDFHTPDYDNQIKNKPLGYIYAYYSRGKWIELQRATNYFSTFTPSSIGQSEELKNITLFPNPCNAQAKIKFIGQDKTAHLEIFDINGRLVLNEMVSNSQVINTEDFLPGLYLYSITTTEKVHQGKLLKN